MNQGLDQNIHRLSICGPLTKRQTTHQLLNASL
ncbi:hypothetical protein IHE45_01G058700 [Dioscorea alata]|uniref:Uncharacterized protein n=1 Tax=Dioscorea alata TaxID=55571 RepID=A0ACB7WUC8_DIOAL|nr:hypothetical protein IHE45_01G058700 [Dioscorea alata]